MKAKPLDIWVGVFAAEYVRLRVLGSYNMMTVAEEAARVADLAVRAYLSLPPEMQGF